MSHSSFSLIKWYLDCISDDGDAFIGYAATLRYKLISIGYSGIIEHSSALGTKSAYTILGAGLPSEEGGLIRWKCAGLDRRGSWSPLAPGIAPQMLLSDRGGTLEWHCMQPASSALVEGISSASRLHGLGYAERLELSIRPWELPISTLHWGRFVSPEHYLVWIEWVGPHPLKLSFHNAQRLQDVQIGPSSLRLDEGRGRLELTDTVTLREGSLDTTALGVIPGLEKLFPGVILKTVERKYRSRGTLMMDGSAPAHGWVIHEVVHWA